MPTFSDQISVTRFSVAREYIPRRRVAFIQRTEWVEKKSVAVLYKIISKPRK